MGTPAFAVPVLSALVEAGQEVVAVYTRPDRPAGRGRRQIAPPVKRFAEERGLRVLQPATLKPSSVRQELASLSPDIAVVAAYGRLIPSETLSLPRLGFLNVHPSMLPRYRGPSPVSAAILNGDDVTGVTIIKLDEGMDSGPIVASRETHIGPDETAEALTARLFELGAALLVDVLPRWARGEIEAQPQEHSKATVTRLLSKEDGEIDWRLDAAQIARQVRAYQPWPGSFTHWHGKLLKIIGARAVGYTGSAAASPGRVVALPDGRLAAVAVEGALVLDSLQLEGRRAVSAKEFAQGHRDFVGSSLGE